MFGLGQKRQEKKAKKELEKLEKKEAKVKEKLAKLEEKQRKKEEKKNKKKGAPEAEKPSGPQHRYDIVLIGTEPYINQIRYELTQPNPEYSNPLTKPEEGDKLYKYIQKELQGEFSQEDDGRIKVIFNGFTAGYIPDDQTDEVLKIFSDYPECHAYCDIIGGEYKEYTDEGVEKGTDPYIVRIILRY